MLAEIHYLRKLNIFANHAQFFKMCSEFSLKLDNSRTIYNQSLSDVCNSMNLQVTASHCIRHMLFLVYSLCVILL